MSSTEAEAIEWERAAEAMLRVKDVLGACRLRSVSCEGHVDNDALCLAVAQGSSAKLVSTLKRVSGSLHSFQSRGTG